MAPSLHVFWSRIGQQTLVHSYGDWCNGFVIVHVDSVSWNVVNDHVSFLSFAESVSTKPTSCESSSSDTSSVLVVLQTIGHMNCNMWHEDTMKMTWTRVATHISNWDEHLDRRDSTFMDALSHRQSVPTVHMNGHIVSLLFCDRTAIIFLEFGRREICHIGTHDRQSCTDVKEMDPHFVIAALFRELTCSKDCESAILRIWKSFLNTNDSTNPHPSVHSPDTSPVHTMGESSGVSKLVLAKTSWMMLMGR